MARFYGLMKGKGDQYVTREGSANSGLNLTGRNLNGDVEVYLGVRTGAGATEADDWASVTVRNHDTGAVGLSLYHGPIAKLLQGGRLALMEYLLEGASKAEKAKIVNMLANKALREQFAGDDT